MHHSYPTSVQAAHNRLCENECEPRHQARLFLRSRWQSAMKRIDRARPHSAMLHSVRKCCDFEAARNCTVAQIESADSMVMNLLKLIESDGKLLD